MPFFIKIPKDRVGVIVGKDGVVRRHLEKQAKVKITIDSKTGDVTITEKEGADPAVVMGCCDAVNAIAIGMSPNRAYSLLKEDYYFQQFDVRDYVGKDSKHVRRMRARIIGSNGKTRRIIEDMADVDMSIQENSIAIIGDVVDVQIASQAIDMLLSGSEHSAVYRFLERKRKEKKLTNLGLDSYFTRR